jgi:hypothetical protein
MCRSGVGSSCMHAQNPQDHIINNSFFALQTQTVGAIIESLLVSTRDLSFITYGGKRRNRSLESLLESVGSSVKSFANSRRNVHRAMSKPPNCIATNSIKSRWFVRSLHRTPCMRNKLMGIRRSHHHRPRRSSDCRTCCMCGAMQVIHRL